MLQSAKRKAFFLNICLVGLFITSMILTGLWPDVHAQLFRKPSATAWTASDIGSVGKTGAFTKNGNTLLVSGAGSDIGGKADQFRYVYQERKGDSEIVARITSLQKTDAWAKAGVMLRETLAPNAKFALMALTPTPAHGASFSWRSATRGSASATNLSGIKLPYWIKVTRKGNLFTGYVSANGSGWKKVNAHTINMSSTIYLGLAVTAHTRTHVSKVAFVSVTLKGALPGTTITPTPIPNTPTATPTKVPTATPTRSPTALPTKVPTATPTVTPTKVPTATPTQLPTATPQPTEEPEPTPTETVTPIPTEEETATPTPVATMSTVIVIGITPAPTVTPVSAIVSASGQRITDTSTVINLSQEGTRDWVHWGLGGMSGFDQKNTAEHLISRLESEHGTPIAQQNTSIAYRWSDGSPISDVDSTTTGVSMPGVGNGLGFSVPAASTPRTLRIYLSITRGQGTLNLALSGSSAAYTTTLKDTLSTSTFVYTVTFQAASNDQSLSIHYSLQHDNGGGSISLQSATLQQGSATTPAALRNAYSEKTFLKSSVAHVESLPAFSMQGKERSERIEQNPNRRALDLSGWLILLESMEFFVLCLFFGIYSKNRQNRCFLVSSVQHVR